VVHTIPAFAAGDVFVGIELTWRVNETGPHGDRTYGLPVQSRRRLPMYDQLSVFASRVPGVHVRRAVRKICLDHDRLVAGVILLSMLIDRPVPSIRNCSTSTRDRAGCRITERGGAKLIRERGMMTSSPGRCPLPATAINRVPRKNRWHAGRSHCCRSTAWPNWSSENV